MENLEQISSTSSMPSYRVKHTKTVADLLKELKMESKTFAILANGKRVDLKDELKEGTELTLLPRIAGGY